jgi:hypothetical protein
LNTHSIKYNTGSNLVKEKGNFMKSSKKIKKFKKIQTHAENPKKENELFEWEEMMSKDLDKIYDKWCEQGIPVEVATIFPANYMVNFVFFVSDPKTANHILMSAISKELSRYKIIDQSEKILQ